MTYQYLLDTNIISDLVRHLQGLVFQRLAAVEENCICTSIIVVCELRFGAAKSGFLRLLQQLESILEVLTYFVAVVSCGSALCGNSYTPRANRKTHRPQ